MEPKWVQYGTTEYAEIEGAFSNDSILIMCWQADVVCYIAAVDSTNKIAYFTGTNKDGNIVILKCDEKSNWTTEIRTVRDIQLQTTDLTPGTSALTAGTICLVYE